jgi:DNA polymerase-3 subunit gamma/tau
LDQCLSFTEGTVTEETVSGVLGTVDTDFMKRMAAAIADKNLVTLLNGVDDLVNEGKDLRLFLHDLLEYFRNLLLVKLSRGGESVSGVADYLSEILVEQGALFKEDQLFSIIQAFGEAESLLKFSSQQRISLEISLIKAAGFQNNSFTVAEAEKQTAEHHNKKQPPNDAGFKIDTKETAAQVSEQPMKETGFQIDTIKEHWKKVLEGVRKLRPSTYAYLVEGVPVEIKGNKIILAFKPNFQLHMQNLEMPNNKSLVEKVLSMVYKENLSVQGVLASAGERGTDLAEEAKELFGVDVVEIKD